MDTRFIPIGRPSNPRWLVPADHRVRDDDFVGWGPYRTSSRLAWKTLKTLLRCGGAQTLALFASTPMDWAMEVDWHSIGWIGTSPPTPLIYIGTPGKKRKAVFHLIDAKSHRCELIVKVPMAEGACDAIRHEAETLTTLEREGFLSAPRLVHYDLQRGISSQTVIRGTTGGTELSRPMLTVLRSLVSPDRSITLSEVADDLTAKQELLAPEAARNDVIASALAELAEDHSPLAVTRVHGDFAPWNIKTQADGSAGLIDWEESKPAGLPLHDAYHFVHTRNLLFGREPQAAFASMPTRSWPLVTLAQYRKLELAYLLQELLQEDSPDKRKRRIYLAGALQLALAARS